MDQLSVLLCSPPSILAVVQHNGGLYPGFDNRALLLSQNLLPAVSGGRSFLQTSVLPSAAAPPGYDGVC